MPCPFVWFLTDAGCFPSQIFETMQRYDLGIEEATKAIVVSKAMRRAMIACESSAQAVDILTSKISLSNLLYDSSDEGVDGNMSSSSIRPELRVEPVVTTRKTRQAAVKMARPTGNSSSSSSSSRSNKPMTGRKRSIEETAPLEEKNEKRVRADSVTKEVEEKINAKKSTEEDASDNDSSSSSSLSPSSLRTPVVRGKRGIRVDDSETQTHVHKRIRGSEDC
jgi:hypothetical protein